MTRTSERRGPTIDAHAHFLPDSARDAYRRGAPWHGTRFAHGEGGVLVAERDGHRFRFGSPEHFEDMASRVSRMDGRRVDTELLSLLPPLFGYGWPLADAVAAARDVNDELSALSKEFPGRFLGLACVPLRDPAAAVDELARAMALPGIVGVAIGSHVGGANLDAAALIPFWRAAQELRAFVLIHPIAPRDRDALGAYHLRNIIGNPYETAIAAASLILSGRLAELPELVVCLAHGGGYLPAALGRLEHAYQVRPDTPAGTGASPREQARRFRYDTLTHDQRALRWLVDTVGADRVVLGTDYPAEMGQPDAVAAIEGSGLFTPAERAAMLGGNLVRVLEIHDG
jgi:aminocarboxymuconate-semialdehyde decarboxylase